jgi:hypothetical protein
MRQPAVAELGIKAAHPHAHASKSIFFFQPHKASFTVALQFLAGDHGSLLVIQIGIVGGRITLRVSTRPTWIVSSELI